MLAILLGAESEILGTGKATFVIKNEWPEIETVVEVQQEGLTKALLITREDKLLHYSPVDNFVVDPGDCVIFTLGVDYEY